MTIASSVTSVLPASGGDRASSRIPTPADDALEYLRLSIKRWKYYSALGFAMPDLAAARAAIAADPDTELGFLLLASSRESDVGILVFCFLRRVWTGRVVVDLLSVQPGIFSHTTGRPAFGGLGAGLLASVAKLTLQLDAPASGKKQPKGPTVSTATCGAKSVPKMKQISSSLKKLKW